MKIFYSILLLLIGIIFIHYTYRNRSLDDNIYDKSLDIRGYIMGVLFILIGVYTLLKGW